MMKNLNNTAHRILDIAEIFTQVRGFNNFSYKDIQAEVGIKTSSIHYYFPTKKDLASVMAHRYTDSFLEKLSEIEHKNKEPFACLQELGNMFIHLAKHEKFCLCGMLSVDISAISEESSREVKRFYTEAEHWIARMFSKAKAMQQIKDEENEKTLALQYLSILEGGLLLVKAHGDTNILESIISDSLNKVRI